MEVRAAHLDGWNLINFYFFAAVLCFFLRMRQYSWKKCKCLLCLSHQSGKRVSEEKEDDLLSSSIWAYTAVSSEGATESVKAQTTGCLEL